MQATLDQIKDLRNRTGAGINSVKEALEASNSLEDAIAYLREKGLAKSAKRAGRAAQNGVIGVYRHGDDRMVVLVEVATETDFASASADVKKFANDLALQIAAMNAEYVDIASVPENIVEQEKAAAKADVEGKPAEVAEKIMAGKLEKFYKETVLMQQKLFTDESKTVQDYANELVAKIGEKLEITRFVKLQINQPTVAANLY